MEAEGSLQMKEKKMGNLAIDGTIVNLCAVHGLSPRQTADLILSASKYAPDTETGLAGLLSSDIGANLCSEISCQKVKVGDSLYLLARERITRIESAIQHLNDDPSHSLTDWDWEESSHRKLKPKEIIEALEHVISRPTPQTDKDILLDAERFLLKSGLYFDSRVPRNKATTYQGKPSIKIDITETNATIRVDINDNTISRNNITGKITVGLINEIPETIRQSISKKCDRSDLAVEVIDWDGFSGPYPSRLCAIKTTFEYQMTGFSEEIIQIVIDTGCIEIDCETGAIREKIPSSTQG